jgi:APA family basic amino acid/polyamine antiporter
MASHLFAKKPLSLIHEEMQGENRLRRVLGPIQLTSLGVGAIIGAGIFVTTGVIAQQTAGPALMLSLPRVLLAMSRDGLLPASFFGAVHERFRTPYKSTILTGVFVGLMAAFLPINILLNLVNMGTLLAFAIVCAAVWIMRRTHPNAERPFRAPLVPLVPILGILSCLLLMFSLPSENWLRLIIWLALGLVIYFGYSRKHSIMAQPRAK